MDIQTEMMQLTVALVVVLQMCLKCLFCYCRGTICSCPTHVVAEQQSSSGHTLSYIRNCIWHDKTSRLLFNKVVTNHSRQNTQSLVFFPCLCHIIIGHFVSV